MARLGSTPRAADATGRTRPDSGALVLSLDLELVWGMLGVADVDGSWREVALRTREVIPELLDRFVVHDVGATWAAVGLLFAESGEEARAFAPEIRPTYHAPILDPFLRPIGPDERSDPTSLAPSLLRAIAACPRQEIGSHSYAHHCTLEPGHDLASFRSDVAAAVAIARAHGVQLRSWVWPRHQVRRDGLAVLAEHGFRAHRGPPRHRWYAPAPGRQGGPAVRAGRLLDAYLPLTGPGSHRWSTLERTDGVTDVPESRFLRAPPHAALSPARGLEPLRVERIVRALRYAARHGEVLHVWWHPHNLAVDPHAGLAAVDAVLAAFGEMRDRYGMRSLTMEEAAEAAGSLGAAAAAVGAADDGSSKLA